jgi:hypothetical protein
MEKGDKGSDSEGFSFGGFIKAVKSVRQKMVRFCLPLPCAHPLIFAAKVKFFGGSPTSDEDGTSHSRGGSTTPTSSPSFSLRMKLKKAVEPLQLPRSPVRLSVESPSAPICLRAASMGDIEASKFVHARLRLHLVCVLMHQQNHSVSASWANQQCSSARAFVV